MNSTTDRLPAVLANLRDVSSASSRLRAGVLLRSDAPLPDDDHLGYAETWPPRTIVDLRRASEGGPTHPLLDHARVVSVPVLEKAPYDMSNLPPSLPELYRSMLEGEPARRLVEVVEVIATGEAPVLVHCTAGKDRTGVSVALALSLVGIERPSIVADYLLTADNMTAVRARMDQTLASTFDPASMAAIPAAMHAAPREAIEAFLTGLDAYGGGARGWFLAHGGRPEVLDRLASRLLSATE